MAHQTRSGKVFRHLYAPEQVSNWAEASSVLEVVLNYLDFDSLLLGRRVCQAWRDSFSTSVTKLRLQHLPSSRAALKLGRKAAAAFSHTTTVCLKLLADPEPILDLTTENLQLVGPDSLEAKAVAAGASLLRQLSKANRLQQLQLITGTQTPCTFLPALLKAAPQLRVLDLGCCAHRPDDLLVLSQHAPALQELLLHCQAFVTLSGRRIRHGNPEWYRHGGNTDYRLQQIAALARLPQLQLLELPLRSYNLKKNFVNWFIVVGSLTSLTGLHAISHPKLSIRPPAAAMTALSSLTQLRELRCDAGDTERRWRADNSEEEESEEDAQAKCWGTVLPCMPHLTRLELVEAAAGDPLLCAIGNSAPQLQRLILEKECWRAESSKQGADAIAHVGHIKLVIFKGFACSKNLPVLQLPGLKQVYFTYPYPYPYPYLEGYSNPGGVNSGGLGWTKETCRCEDCLYNNR